MSVEMEALDEETKGGYEGSAAVGAGEKTGAATAPLRILIIAHAFPPINATASLRPYSWAKTWADMGHDVHVLTPQKYGFDGSASLGYDSSGFRVHVVPYLGGRLRHKRTVTDMPRRQSVDRWERLKRSTRRLRFGLGMFADLRMLAYRALLTKGLEVIERQRFDFVISTYPPQVVHLAAHSITRKAGVPWIADYRDLWQHDGTIYQWRATSFLMGCINKRILRAASLVSTVSAGLAQTLTEALRRKVVVCYNGFMADQGEGIRAREDGNEDERVRIVYTGRLYPGKRDPRLFFEGLKELKRIAPDTEERIRVDFYGYEDPWLRELVRKYDLEGCVALHAFVSYAESIKAQQNADLLLFLDWTDEHAQGILTGKLFEYLRSGRPIISVGSRKDTEAARIIDGCKSGVTLTSPSELVEYLSTVLRERPTLAPDEDMVGSYARERQAALLLGEIRGELAGRESH